MIDLRFALRNHERAAWAVLAALVISFGYGCAALFGSTVTDVVADKTLGLLEEIIEREAGKALGDVERIECEVDPRDPGETVVFILCEIDTGVPKAEQ